MLITPGRTVQAALTLALCTGVALAAPKTQAFSVPTTWNVPAATLQPGNYSIQVVDKTSDRSIVKIESADGSVHSTFIAIASRKIPTPGHAGPVMWSSAGGDPYVRGWVFPGSSTVMEFAYPKASAVAIARRQQSPVLAVDPDSEGMKPVPNALASQTDMEVISLWLLSANQVGPDPEKAEIKAARYQAGASIAEPKHVAAVTGTRLPKTASNSPLLFLLAIVAFGLALSVRYLRETRA